MGTWNAIYLGNLASIDPYEGNNNAENASALVGQSFGSPGTPILADELTITTYDGGGYNDVLDNNNNGTYDWIRTDIGNGEQWYRFDAAATYNATVTYVDGTTDNTVVVIFQDTSGNTFLAPSLSASGNAVLNDAPLQSLTLNSVYGTSYSGLAATRSLDVFLACFVRGTLIETIDGPRYVETLQEGDLVMTKDRGPQPLVWTGGRKIEGAGKMAPIRFEAGALGNIRPLLVSPQHRMLVTGWQAELHFGQTEVLVAAKALVNSTTIRPVEMPQVSYHHILFEQHEIVLSEGIHTESFHPGRDLLAHDVEMYEEMVAIFPELAKPNFVAPFPTARHCLKLAEAQVLAA
ncbi:MAG: Hint domain-containing protein [Yoonia sp.]|jgi:hypothetical protein|nr:Hint domain-containing protein [Yoonia sp.]